MTETPATDPENTLILELEQSRSGLLRISEEPLRFVLRRIGG